MSKASPAVLLAGIIAIVGCEHRPTKPGVKSEPQEDPWKPKINHTVSVPRIFDEEAIKTLEVPHADAKMDFKHVSANYYYSIPVRPIYKSYPIYHPDREPKEHKDYRAWLKQQKAEVLWDDKKAPSLKTEEDWINAGKLVFESALGYDDDPFASFITTEDVRDPDWYAQMKMPLTAEGVMPFGRYVVTDKGVQVGNLSCAMCHTRVQPDRSVIPGGQGNFPNEQLVARIFRQMAAKGKGEAQILDDQYFVIRLMFGAPWMGSRDPSVRYNKLNLAQLIAACDIVPPGAMARHGSSHFAPVQVPDLIGLADRRYFDRTGLVQHRSIADVGRYVALNQGIDLLNTYNDFIPSGLEHKFLPGPDMLIPAGRYSDEQLHALAKYLYSLRPPENPFLPKAEAEKAVVERGRMVFERENCARCHSGLSYSNNRLTPVEGFAVPKEHFEKFSIVKESVGTDPGLSLETRRGTGYYKVPSLRGVWYRGPFEHSGSVMTLEDWFDPRRIKADYVPTGWRGPPGTRTRAVPGHEFGLDLNDADRKALIAFLKTL